DFPARVNQEARAEAGERAARAVDHLVNDPRDSGEGEQRRGQAEAVQNGISDSIEGPAALDPSGARRRAPAGKGPGRPDARGHGNEPNALVFRPRQAFTKSLHLLAHRRSPPSTVAIALTDPGT